MHHNNILIYKSQQDAHVTEFILSDNCSTCFGITITHLQEHKTTATIASGSHYTVIDRVKIYYSVTATRRCSYSCFVLLKMGDSDA